jgi:hypothetical protein
MELSCTDVDGYFHVAKDTQRGPRRHLSGRRLDVPA